MDPVLIERGDAVAVVTINRPERRNALTTMLKVALRDALVAVGEDPEVRAVVLTGAGEHFCAGQDLGEHAAILEEDPDGVFGTVAEHYSPIVEALATMPKPVVAAVEGTCVGAGLGFALAADLRVFARNAVLATAFSGIGLTCDSGLSHSLPRSVGEARARELVLLAEAFTPDEAVGWGIAGRIADPGAALAEARDVARRLAAGPTSAYAESKRLLATSGSLQEALAAESDAQTRLGTTEDHRSAVAAFLAKTKPTFTGR